MMAGVITNGFLLNEERIERFNAAGLDYLQISIDNVEPDEVSLKSLKTLDSAPGHAGAARRVSRQHQLGARRRRARSGRRAGRDHPRASSWA